MTWFVVIAVVFVLLALLWIMPVLLRRGVAGGGLAAEDTNLAVLKDQLAELERDIANGTLSQQQYQQARMELDRRVLEDGRATGAVAGEDQQGSSRRTAVALAIAIPLCAALLYFQLGNPGAMSWRAAEGGAHKVTPQEMDNMAAKLAARLEQNPNDGNGWALLGRSYMVMQRFGDATAAYARAAALIKDDAGLLADYADAMAMQQGRSLEGKPMQLIEQALKLDPNHWKALAMAGSAAFDRKDYRKAIVYWEKLHSIAPPDSEFARSVASNIAEARELGGVKGSAPAPKSTPAVAASGAAGSSVRGTVSLAGALAAKAGPNDTVFIYARAADGPRMPLAIVRKQVKDLPAEFTLDDSQAMTPEMKLSNFAEIVVSARISKDASATPQSGDLQGASKKIKAGATPVKIVIDQVVP